MEEQEEAAWMTMSDEDRFRSMAEKGADRLFDENLPIFRAELARLLAEMESDQMESPAEWRDHAYVFSVLDWAEGLEDTTVNIAKYIAADRDDRRRGAAHFAAAKEPALAETLRCKAAWSDAKRTELLEIAAGARRLRGMCLSAVAAAEEEDIVCVAAAELLAHLATYMTKDGDSIPAVFPYRAVADQLVHAAVAAGASDPAAVRFVEGFAERARMFTRGAAERGGEDAVKLMEHAATVEALCADTEGFLRKMVSSPYWRMWRCFFE